MWPWLKHQGLVLCIGVQYWIRKVRWHALSAFTMSLSKCLNGQSYSLGFPLGFLRQKVGFLSMFSLRSLHFLLCPLMCPIHSTGLSIESIGQSLVWAVPPLHHEAIWNHFEDTRTRYKQRPSAWLADWTVIWYISCDMSRNLDLTTSLRFPTWWGPIKVGLPTSFLAFKRYSMVRLCPPKPFDADASVMHLLW